MVAGSKSKLEQRGNEDMEITPVILIKIVYLQNYSVFK